MIQTALLHQAYGKLGITVSDDEIRQAALTSPPPEVTGLAEFQVNGRFDLAKWQQFVTSGSNPEFLLALEQRYRDEIPYVKFLQFLTADVYVSDAHLWRMYRDDVRCASRGFNTPTLVYEGVGFRWARSPRQAFLRQP